LTPGHYGPLGGVACSIPAARPRWGQP
jgi:uncharacterized cysteine cluster protein YcgN (CxxCxxCC family)